MASNEANMQIYHQNKLIFDTLEIENALKKKQILRLERDIDILNRTRGRYENAIEKFYTQTKRDADYLPEDMIFEDRFFNELNKILRGPAADQAEGVLIKGRNAAFREIMRIEEEIEKNIYRMSRVEEKMNEARDSID